MFSDSASLRGLRTQPILGTLDKLLGIHWSRYFIAVGRFKVVRNLLPTSNSLLNVSVVVEVAPVDVASRMETDTLDKPCRV